MVRGRRSEVRCQKGKDDDGRRRAEVGREVTDVRGRRSEVRREGQWSGVRRERAEEGKGQRAEDRRQKAADRGRERDEGFPFCQ